VEISCFLSFEDHIIALAKGTRLDGFTHLSFKNDVVANVFGSAIFYLLNVEGVV